MTLSRENALRKALDEQEAISADLLAALEENQAQQEKALTIMRKHGFKFETPLHESEGFEKLAFTFYSMLCEVESVSRAAITNAEEEGAEGP